MMADLRMGLLLLTHSCGTVKPSNPCIHSVKSVKADVFFARLKISTEAIESFNGKAQFPTGLFGKSRRKVKCLEFLNFMAIIGGRPALRVI
jgi:hypothetical protein